MVTDESWHLIKVKKLAPVKFKNLVDNIDNLYILDVRPLNYKRNRFFIKGSYLCPLVYLADRFQDIPKDREIVITDWEMKQSPIAAKFLTSKGYKIRGVLKGGIERWEFEKNPTEQRQLLKELPPLQ